MIRSWTAGARARMLGLLLLLAATACGTVGEDTAPTSEYEVAVEQIRELVRAEMRDKSLPAVSIALVDGQDVVWAEGFGSASADGGEDATAATVYRVGSVSKLFTDIAIMQLVERGELDLDAPVTTYLPDFQPENPFGEDITLRQLMSHRAGLVREPPVGNYFDPESPSLAETVASLNDTELVYAPETRSKYSNAGIAVVGRVLEATQEEPFAGYLDRTVLQPLGMTHSSFEPRPEITERLADATMWTYDHRTFEAPTFQLGMAPAGSMYSTVGDLARFATALFAGGEGENGRILQEETLQEMWTPQYADAGQSTGFGIGFAIGELDGHRRIGHGGAIYGFATELALLPEERLAAVVVTTRDLANSVTTRIADYALKAALATRDGEALPTLELTEPVPAERAASLEGRYQGGGRTVDLVHWGDTLFMHGGATRVALRTVPGTGGDTLVVDDVLSHGTRIVPADGGLRIGDTDLQRVAVERPSPPPAHWRGLIGEYGWDHNILYIREVDGQLHAQIEWFFSYPLEEVSRDVYRFPDYGLYDGETLVFERDGSGEAVGVVAASVRFPRREVGTAEGETFRIDPVRPVEELREEALAAEPPEEEGEFREPDLVEPAVLDPSIQLDVRYASTNNFMSAVFYDEHRVFLQRPAAEAVVRAQQRLAEHGLGLVLHDGYRPWYVTKMFWDATPESMKIFVANPADGSRHNRGAAIDLSLYDLETGEPAPTVGGYDEFSHRSYPDYPGGTSLQRWRREVLRDAMEAEGFDVYAAEWWHFDYGDWSEYPIQNFTFEEIDQRTAALR
ncbi:MAG TPA: serine hydrolase [Longimicrobiales bacterium]|nr:serine hydrolase [Longimicrobiales bacterium]